MIADKDQLLEIIRDLERGIVLPEGVKILRGAIERLDEMDDLVDAVCTCRTSEIPVLRGGAVPCLPSCTRKLEFHAVCTLPGDDDAPGRP